MSYDLDLFLPKPGMHANEAGAQAAVEERVRTPPSAENQKHKQAMARALCEIHPEFVPARPLEAADLEQAVRNGVSVWRNIELEDRSKGIDVVFFDDSVSIHLPGTHRGEAARAVWKILWECLECLQNQAGYRAWDRQAGKVLDIARDFNEALDAYAGYVGIIDGVVERERGTKPKPWWKFW